MAYTTLFTLLAALLAVCSSANIRMRQVDPEQIPFVPLADIIEAADAAGSNVTKRQFDEIPEEPTLAYQTYRTCNYIALLVFDFSADETGTAVFTGGNMSYIVYVANNPPASPEFTVVPSGIYDGVTYFLTAWEGSFPKCSNLIINITLTNIDGTIVRQASFHRKLACKCPVSVENGDPHVRPLDGGSLNVNGKCVYRLVQDCIHDPPDWEVFMTNGDPVGRTGTLRIASATLNMFNHNVEMFPDGTAVCDGEEIILGNRNFALTPDLKIAILPSPDDQGDLAVSYEDKFFLEVDSSYKIKFGLKDQYMKGGTCGLLGNNNDDKTDDLYYNGIENYDPEPFIDYWVVPGSCR